MKVFVVERNDWNYDDDVAIAVFAENEEEARQEAYNNRDNHEWDEYYADFLDPALSSCEELDTSKPGVILVYDIRG